MEGEYNSTRWIEVQLSSSSSFISGGRSCKIQEIPTFTTYIEIALLAAVVQVRVYWIWFLVHTYVQYVANFCWVDAFEQANKPRHKTRFDRKQLQYCSCRLQDLVRVDELSMTWRCPKSGKLSSKKASQTNWYSFGQQKLTS
jgi:hypothetical protein